MDDEFNKERRSVNKWIHIPLLYNYLITQSLESKENQGKTSNDNALFDTYLAAYTFLAIKQATGGGMCHHLSNLLRK